MGVADQRDALALRGEPTGLLHGEEGLAAARSPADLDAVEQADGVEDDGLVFGERVGGVLVGQRAGDDVCVAVIPCRSTPLTSWSMPSCVEQRPVELLADRGRA